MKMATGRVLGFALLAMALHCMAGPGDPVYTVRMLDGKIWRLNHLSVNGKQKFTMDVGGSNVDAKLSTIRRVQFTGKPEQRGSGTNNVLWRTASVTYQNTSSQNAAILVKGYLGKENLQGTDTRTSAAVRIPLADVKSIEFPRDAQTKP